MANPSDDNVVKELLHERNSAYANAWSLTGTICSLAPIQEGLSNMLLVLPQAYLPWVTILCKLLRALGSPRNPDHWKDIAGYATLVFEDLTK